MASLFTLTDQLRELNEALDATVDVETGAVNEEMAAQLYQLEHVASVKLLDWCRWAKSLEAEAEGITKEAKRAALRAKKLNRKVEWIKRQVLWAMTDQGIPSLSDATAVLKLYPSQAVVIDRADKVPRRFIKKTWSEAPVLAEIKAWLKTKKNAPHWAHIEHRKSVVLG